MARTPDLQAHPDALRCTMALALWLLMALAALMVVALAVEMMAELPWAGLIFLAMGLATGAAGVTGAWGTLDMLRLPAPILTIGPAGVHDRRLSATPIPWEAIRWRRVILSTTRANGDTVQLWIDANIPIRPPMRVLAVANRMLGRPPYSVLTFALEIQTDAIAAAMNRYKRPETLPGM
ncbi:MAG: hypothetical protein JJU19_07060 [Pararhodobacter sp.]|nr:hypothetical protein [Pararhodobacter sp.]